MATARTAVTADETIPKGNSLKDQSRTLVTRGVKAQKAVALTWVDLLEKNSKFVLGATDKLANNTPVNQVAEALRKQNKFAASLSTAYTSAVRTYLA